MEFVMKTVNKVVLLGRIGVEPKVINFDNGECKTIIKLPTDEGYGDKKRTAWHTVVFFGKLAEIAKSLNKGDLLHVQGKIEYRTWQDQGGNSRKETEIWAEDISFDRKTPFSNDQDSGANEVNEVNEVDAGGYGYANVKIPDSPY